MEIIFQVLQQIITIIKDVFTCLAAITASVVAVLGLQAWKKQIKGKTEYELAQRLLKSVYRVRNAIAIARVPFTSDDEINQALRAINLDIENGLLPGKDVNRNAVKEAVYQKRKQIVLESLVEFEALSLEAEVLWEQDVRKNLSPINQCVKKLFRGIEGHLELTNEPGKFEGDINETIDIAMDFDSENNLFSREIAQAVSQAEKYIRPHLKI